MFQGKTECFSTQSTMASEPPTSLKLNKLLLVSKLSRYDFERCRHVDLSESELETVLRKRGADYDSLIKNHKLHKEFEQNVKKAFEDAGIEARVVNRFDYTMDKINWADMICAVGGDGTFLLAAGRVTDNQKPVIGFNSDPRRSEGYLSLHKKYSSNIEEAVRKLKQGEFKWRFRNRIRILLCGENVHEDPIELHEQELLGSNQRFFSGAPESRLDSSEQDGPTETNVQQRRLPVLALNEVFIGENLSARVSYYEMRINDGPKTKIKSSGLCVTTGTGSTSWNLSINRLTQQSVSEVLRLLQDKRPDLLPALSHDTSLVHDLAEEFNSSLVFSAEDSRMGYTIRDLISAGVWPQPKGVEPRGFASRIEVKSRCLDAGLVVDGGLSFRFNDGTVAILEIHECDALRTVELNEP
ncbi:hypothetical protein ONE63_004587 [Megalurothrips usitatus]|uniref:NAD kinase 2, mitochondrial n=1 Tax=Megalurothrips usitatus TaxID=439358 RepID=A0AAV7X3D0_9NEOP|nr:hypothetical protein ONE63_004587 [Megalurothrips usitatus]